VTQSTTIFTDQKYIVPLVTPLSDFPFGDQVCTTCIRILAARYAHLTDLDFSDSITEKRYGHKNDISQLQSQVLHPLVFKPAALDQCLYRKSTSIEGSAVYLVVKISIKRCVVKHHPVPMTREPATNPKFPLMTVRLDLFKRPRESQAMSFPLYVPKSYKAQICALLAKYLDICILLCQAGNPGREKDG